MFSTRIGSSFPAKLFRRAHPVGFPVSNSGGLWRGREQRRRGSDQSTPAEDQMIRILLSRSSFGFG